MYLCIYVSISIYINAHKVDDALPDEAHEGQREQVEHAQQLRGARRATPSKKDITIF